MDFDPKTDMDFMREIILRPVELSGYLSARLQGLQDGRQTGVYPYWGEEYVVLEDENSVVPILPVSKSQLIRVIETTFLDHSHELSREDILGIINDIKIACHQASEAIGELKDSRKDGDPLAFPDPRPLTVSSGAQALSTVAIAYEMDDEILDAAVNALYDLASVNGWMSGRAIPEFELHLRQFVCGMYFDSFSRLMTSTPKTSEVVLQMIEHKFDTNSDPLSASYQTAQTLLVQSAILSMTRRIEQQNVDSSPLRAAFGIQGDWAEIHQKIEKDLHHLFQKGFDTSNLIGAQFGRLINADARKANEIFDEFNMLKRILFEPGAVNAVMETIAHMHQFTSKGDPNTVFGGIKRHSPSLFQKVFSNDASEGPKEGL